MAETPVQSSPNVAAVQPQRRTGVRRGLFLTSGILFVGLGTLGLFVPVMPSTIFFILALWAFKRSSERLENWLLQHRIVGPTLRDWDENKWIRRRTKVVAITMIWLCIGVSCYFVHKPFVYGILAITALSLTWYIASRLTKPDAVA
ncbi:MAG: YbaN family protein [Fimbriimonadaceae bacterium]|nr:YbaN family protein [Fimbriimonadaceae bacterium]